MTKILIEHDNIIRQIKIYDHANFDENGHDIVCASISSLAFAVINHLQNNNNFKFVIDETNVKITLKQINYDSLVEDYFVFLKSAFENLQVDYPKNISITQKNVKEKND